MKHLVAITRNEEFTCECGLTAEKIGFIVSFEDGSTGHYGSECIKKVMGSEFDVKSYELKKGWQSIKLAVKKLNFEKDGAYCDCGYGVLRLGDGKAKIVHLDQVIITTVHNDDFTKFKNVITPNPDYNKEDNTFNYVFKGTKAQLEELKLLQV